MPKKDDKQPEGLTGPEKAAIFLLTLGEEFTTEIFKELEDIEIKDLGKAMSKIQNVTPTQVQEQQQSFTAAKAKKADGRLQGKPSYDLEQIKRDTMNNTDIKF